MKRLVLSMLLIFSICYVVPMTAHAQGSEKSTITCQECGVINSSDGLFCAGCGSKLTHPTKPSTPQKSLNNYDDIFDFDSNKRTIIDKSADKFADSPKAVISDMSREDLIRLIELLTDNSYNNSVQPDPNLVGNMTKAELERLFKSQVKMYTKPQQNGFQKFLQVVGFVTTVTLILVLLA